MNQRAGQNRIFWRALGVALLVHASLLLIPSVRYAVFEHSPVPSLQLNLKRPAAEQPMATEPETPVETIQPDPVEIEQNPPEPVMAQVPESVKPPETEPQVTSEPERPLTPRLLSRQFDYEKQADPLAGFTRMPEEPPRAEFQYRERDNLETVLNEPSMQLPFKDTRIYLVDSYDPGWSGSVDRFFDNVTVPFGFTTKHGTRVECRWMLIVAGCGWGPARTFYKGQQARRNPETTSR